MKKLKNIFIGLIFGFIVFFSFNSHALAKTVNVYVFYGQTCPHCEEAREYLKSVKDKYDINLIEYEVWYNKDNMEIMNDVAQYLDINVKGVPFVIINNTPIVGYSSSSTSQTYVYHINNASKSDFIDKVGMHLGVVENNEKSLDHELNLFGKKINLKNTNVLLSTMMLGILDSFDIFMFWGILLISVLLININNDKKAFTIAMSSFLVMLLFYFILLMSGIKYDKYLNIINIFRILLSVLLIILGIIGLIKILKNMDEEKENTNALKRSKLKNIVLIITVIILMVSVLLISFMNYGGIPNLILNVYEYKNISMVVKMILLMIYLLTFALVYILFYLFLHKIFIKLKLYDNANNALVISSIIVLFTGILLGLKPLWLTFNF